jgi:hypothetical protein
MEGMHRDSLAQLNENRSDLRVLDYSVAWRYDVTQLKICDVVRDVNAKFGDVTEFISMEAVKGSEADERIFMKGCQQLLNDICYRGTR